MFGLEEIVELDKDGNPVTRPWCVRRGAVRRRDALWALPILHKHMKGSLTISCVTRTMKEV